MKAFEITWKDEAFRVSIPNYLGERERREAFRRIVVSADLGRLRVGEEAEARTRLYPRRGLVSVLAGGVGFQKNDGQVPVTPWPSDPKE